MTYTSNNNAVLINDCDILKISWSCFGASKTLLRPMGRAGLSAQLLSTGEGVLSDQSADRFSVHGLRASITKSAPGLNISWWPEFSSDGR